MWARTVISIWILATAPVAFGQDAVQADSTNVVSAIREAEPWIAQQVEALKRTSNPVERGIIANALSAHTDSLARQFRTVFPDNDDGWMMFSMYNGLASAVACESPGLAAVYRAVASTALYSGNSPYRPAMYQALRSISDRAWSLARAKRPERVERLLEKLDADRLDLVVAL